MSWESILKKPIQTTTERLEALGLGKDTIATLEGEEKHRGSNLKVLQPRQKLRGTPQTQQPSTAPQTDEEAQTPKEIEQAKRKKLSTKELLGRAQSKVGVSPKSKKPTKTSEQLETERRAASKKLGAGKEQPSMIEAQKENKKGTSPSPYQRRRREIVAERPEREARRQAKLREQDAPHQAKRQEQKLRDERTRQEAVGGRQSRAIEEKIQRDADKAEGKQRLAAMRTETAQSQKDLMGPDSAISQVRRREATRQKDVRQRIGERAKTHQQEGAADLAAFNEEMGRRMNPPPRKKRQTRPVKTTVREPKQTGLTDEELQQMYQQSSNPRRTHEQLLARKKKVQAPKGPTGPPPNQLKQVADKQEQVAGQQQEVVDNLNQTINNQIPKVTKMNNDKYNAKQKGEKNRNLTPFIMPQKERPAPKSGDIPGVVQHPKRRQKKTENKW